MKIAIQGHPTRGKEVIQILKSLGGKTSFTGLGFDERHYYYINPNSIIVESLITIKTKDEFKLYTLEEFEKEFPFKIGDKVQTTPYGEPAEIIKMYLNPACGIAYKVRYKSGVELQHCPENLKFQEMQKERNITLTLDKAKEWYKKGGELKEIALQAFSEKELNPLPRNWEEFCANYPIQTGEAIIGEETSQIRCYYGMGARDLVKDKNVCPSKKSAEAHLAMMQLEQLRDCWRQGWKPRKHECVYTIKFSVGGLAVYQYSSREFLSFPTKEMAKEFLECFRDLIEKAGDLI